MTIALIDVPYHMGQRLPLDLTSTPDVRVSVGGEASQSSDELDRIASTALALRDIVHASLTDGRIPLVIAGDCMAPHAIVAALQRHGVQPAVLWFDSHGDFNTRESSWTGYVAGMSMAMLVGREDKGALARVGGAPVAEGKVTLVDGRHLDPKEALLLEQSEVRIIPVGHAATASTGKSPIYLHLDVDVIDPTEMPAMLWPAPGGPSTEAVLAAACGVIERADVCAVSVGVTLDQQHPSLKDAIERANRVVNVLAACLSRAALKTTAT